jgi:hypothetical protein
MNEICRRWLFSIVVAIALAVPARVETVFGQDAPVVIPPVTGRGWAPVVPIPRYDPDALPPVLIADQDRTVHALVTLPLSDDPEDPGSKELGIFYHRWTQQDGWTTPNDIMLTPVKLQARVKSAFLDNSGTIHMVFYGGDEQEAYTYYTWASAIDAASAQAWAPPVAIGPNAIAPEIAAIAGDGDDHLVVMYAGNLGEGNSLYLTYSDDAGATWSEPQLFFSTYELVAKPFDFAMHFGESGRVHAVWNVTDERGQNVMGYYAVMDSFETRQWSEPLELDKNVGLGIAIPQVTEYNGAVMIMYNNGVEGEVPPVMWFRMSRDGGKTFTEPMRPFTTHIGRNGVISFAEDSADTLHVFFGQRIPGGLGGNIDQHGMWHSTWDGTNWRPLEPVESGSISGTFDPYDAKGVIVQGNQVLLTWRTDPGRDVSSTWYSYTVLDTPELPVQPLPTPPVQISGHGAGLNASDVRSALDGTTDGTIGGALGGLAELLATPTAQLPAQLTAQATLAPTPAPPLEFSRVPGTAEGVNPGVPLLGALIPTLLFVAAALLFGSLRRSN